MATLYSKLNQEYPHECSLLWFHYSSHIELELDGELHNLVCGGRDRYVHSSASQELRTLSGQGAPYYRVQLGLKEQEYLQLKHALMFKDSNYVTCSSGIADLLNRTTDIAIPAFQSLLPLGLYSHFWRTKEDSGSRVQHIRYFGVSEPNTQCMEKMAMPVIAVALFLIMLYLA